MEPSTPKLLIGAGNSIKDTSTPLHLQAHAGLGNWTMDDSINEVIRKVNQGGPSAPPPNQGEYVSSGSASPPTPEPLLKVFEEKNKIVSSVEVKKKLKKELKTKMKKKEKDKPKDKDREKDKGKLKEKNKDKNRDKNKEFSKDVKMPWKEFGLKDDELFVQRDFTLPEGSIKIKNRDGDAPKKEKEKHKDKKKDKEKSKKDKDKRDKGKDRSKDDRQKQSALAPFAIGELPPLFSPSACLRIPSMLPPLAPILQDKEVKSKEKDKKKDKKEKKKKKDKEKDKEREKAKEKEREKEEKRKEKEREKEKREKEKEKEKERIRLEKVMVFCFGMSYCVCVGVVLKFTCSFLSSGESRDSGSLTVSSHPQTDAQSGSRPGQNVSTQLIFQVTLLVVFLQSYHFMLYVVLSLVLEKEKHLWLLVSAAVL